MSGSWREKENQKATNVSNQDPPCFIISYRACEAKEIPVLLCKRLEDDTCSLYILCTSQINEKRRKKKYDNILQMV